MYAFGGQKIGGAIVRAGAIIETNTVHKKKHFNILTHLIITSLRYRFLFTPHEL